MAASVTSHSCQVRGMSSPWHLSNLSYLKLSPPASRWLISPDTSHRPDRESLYPENNPPLLTLHPKSVPPLLFLSSLYFSLPSPSLSIHSPLLLCGLLFLSCFHRSLSNHILLRFYRSQSFLPLSSLLRPHFLARYIIPLLMWICEKKLWLQIEE